jgi:hypothetical protein
MATRWGISSSCLGCTRGSRQGESLDGVWGVMHVMESSDVGCNRVKTLRSIESSNRLWC